MKRLFSVIGFVIVLLLCSCGTSTAHIETLKNWSFQYNKETDDYSLFFALVDKNDEPLWADVDVDIRIVNDENEEVYIGTKSVSNDNYGYYTSQIAGEQYLANVRIPSSELTAGKSSNGTVYFTVYKENKIAFSEAYCSALYCLPIADVTVDFDYFPLNINVKDYFGDVASVLQIQSAEYKFEKEYSPTLDIIIIGEKLSSNSSLYVYDEISYKLYDSDGYIVDSGNVYLDNLNTGDKFKSDPITIYDVTPGESYTFKLFESTY